MKDFFIVHDFHRYSRSDLLLLLMYTPEITPCLDSIANVLHVFLTGSKRGIRASCQAALKFGSPGIVLVPSFLNTNTCSLFTKLLDLALTIRFGIHVHNFVFYAGVVAELKFRGYSNICPVP